MPTISLNLAGKITCPICGRLVRAAINSRAGVIQAVAGKHNNSRSHRPCTGSGFLPNLSPLPHDGNELPPMYYKLVDGKPVKCGIDEWPSDQERRVGLDNVGEVRVSTVFLVLDHAHGGGPPVLFETMVFGGKLDQEQERYCTLEEAKAGHAAMLARVRQEEGDLDASHV